MIRGTGGKAGQTISKRLIGWSVSADIEIARDRYLKIVWKISKPSWNERLYYDGYHGNYLPSRSTGQ